MKKKCTRQIKVEFRKQKIKKRSARDRQQFRIKSFSLYYDIPGRTFKSLMEEFGKKIEKSKMVATLLELSIYGNGLIGWESGVPSRTTS